LNNVNEKIRFLLERITSISEEDVIESLQSINNLLSGVLKTYGTDALDDLLSICFGSTHSIFSNKEEEQKYGLLKRYFHPTSYKIVNQIQNNVSKNKKTVQLDEAISENIKNLDCFDIQSCEKSFHIKVYGLKIYLYHPVQKIYLFIYGTVDDVVLKFITNAHISNASQLISRYLPSEIVVDKSILVTFNQFVQSLTIKDYLIYDYHGIYQKFFGMENQFKLLKQKNLNVIAKEFMLNDLYSKRNTLIHLLIHGDNQENKYIAYLLYDLLSNDTNGNIDTVEQTVLFDSLPWCIKDSFKEAMKNTVQYTNELNNFDMNKIPMEQQICLMKACESVKEKAMIKLKELKAKSDESGSKARHYLEGLLKIPFQIYKREEIMNVMTEIKRDFKSLINDFPNKYIENKDSYTAPEIRKIIKKIKNDDHYSDIKNYLIEIKKEDIISIIRHINEFISKINKTIKSKEEKVKKIHVSRGKKEDLIKDIVALVNNLKNDNTLKEIILKKKISNNLKCTNVETLTKKFDKITEYMMNVKTILDSAIHGHDNAKKQIERIIGQWINGEQDGYCFGFEGPPGVGKTSLAKRGLSNCLKDENGNERPFAMIQMGGETNGSTLHGHNYTYVGSTWGGIVQILIDKKCMNPIIFIDEIDKISQTEHGREIVGILTHLLDPAQNDSFQDKYFSGIDLDLSKALFILSYNDVDSIDKILLDRIHRIKFSCLTLEEKLEVAKTHMLPEIYKKMGMEGMVNFPRDVLIELIEEYVCEPGVRKLKELLFEIVGEINLDILKNKNTEDEFPIEITLLDIKTKYLKDKRELKIQKIHTSHSIGIVNGLWANSLGKGGIIPIQSKFFPSDKFLDLKLTGMQGDVMKESMNVSLTLAWNLTNQKRREDLNELYNQPHISKYGIHVHCPDGAVPKDGPSAGAGITCVMYSLLNNKKIKNDFAITGEISLDGKVTEIGGLDVKFMGGIKAGIKSFIYPKENQVDYSQFFEKHKESNFLKDITFYPVDEISEVFQLIFDENL
jgi:ATP-dependent Lon protease